MSNKPIKSVRTPYGTVNVNVPKIVEHAKRKSALEFDRKMDKLTKITSFSLAIIIAGGMFVLGRKSAKTEVYLPDDYIMTNVELTLEDGIIERAGRQFYDEKYTSVYPTLRDYTDSVEELNGVESTMIQEDQKLLFPIIFDKNNPHYMTKVSLQKQLEDLEKSPEYWVDHVFGGSDTISHLAALASLDNNELYYNIALIESKNNIKSASIPDGTIIKIINPRVGELKRAIQAEHEALLESIKVETKSSQKS